MSYYYDVHLPIAKKINGFARSTVRKVLGTPEGQAAVKDVPNFAGGGVMYADVEQLV